jgi:hypothetical protein
MRNIELENSIKNLVVLILLVFSYVPIRNFFFNLNNPDVSTLTSILGAVGILSVITCFGNFAFTYGEINHKRLISRLIGHSTTGLLMLLIGLSLEMTSTIVRLLIGNFLIFDLSLVILYIACVLYDFWDLERAKL